MEIKLILWKSYDITWKPFLVGHVWRGSSRGPKSKFSYAFYSRGCCIPCRCISNRIGVLPCDSRNSGLRICSFCIGNLHNCQLLLRPPVCCSRLPLQMSDCSLLLLLYLTSWAPYMKRPMEDLIKDSSQGSRGPFSKKPVFLESPGMSFPQQTCHFMCDDPWQPSFFGNNYKDPIQWSVFELEMPLWETISKPNLKKGYFSILINYIRSFSI